MDAVVRVSGGLRSNVIPDEARTVEASGGFDRLPLERSAAVQRLYNQAREIARELVLSWAKAEQPGARTVISPRRSGFQR